MVLMCVTCIDLGWLAVDKILKDHGSNPSQSICCFVFVISFIFSLCPNIKQPRLPIGHLQNENDCHVLYISIYLITIQSFIKDNVLLTHLSYVALDHHLILNA